MNIWSQLRAILLLPGMAVLVIPAIILYFAGVPSLPAGWNLVLPIVGCVFVFVGVVLMSLPIRLFATVGKGTLAPWEPPKKLVVRGIYRHVRNPMITGVFSILLGEAAGFGSLWLLIWFVLFTASNVAFIRFVEEPKLMERFGDDYVLYARHVPRWIPRWNPWDELHGGD